MDIPQLPERVKQLSANFTRTQLASLVGAFVAVVGIVAGSAFYLTRTDYVLLMADMDAEAAAAVVERLKALKVPYHLEAGGRAVRVPSDRADELRLEMTADGMPSSGRIGFEIFDRTAFGATEFLEQVNYRRALEGEIARTIATVSEVGSARVHIALGKETLFGDPRPAKASVLLRLKNPSRPLAAATVAGIQNLVASSIEGLRPESVVIVDTAGRPLARPPAEDDGLGSAQLERQAQIERDLQARVVALLEPIVGAERVRVNVAAALDPKTLQQTEETWDPEGVIRSCQTSMDQAGGGTLPMLVAGARGNQPAPVDPAPTTPAPAGAAAPITASVPSSARQTETVNYELSRVTRQIVQGKGAVTRLSIAVLLDDDQQARKDASGAVQVSKVARTPEELEKVHDLVAAAVGLDATRGDQLTVENVSFDEPIVEPVAPPTMLEQYGPALEQGGRYGVPLLLGLVALMFLVRPALRTMGLLPATRRKGSGRDADDAAAGEPLPTVTADHPRTVSDLEHEIEHELDARAQHRLEGRRLPVLTKKAAALSQKEPEQVARLIRSWMTEEQS